MKTTRKTNIMNRLTGVLFLLLFAHQAFCEASPAVPLVFTQEPIREPVQGDWIFRKMPIDGGRIVLLDSGGELTVLTPEFASAARPSVSFDAQFILFAGKRQAEEPWNIWQMRVDGSEKQQITRNMGDCWDPAYMARSAITAPEFTDKVHWITFASTAAGSYDAYGTEKASALYARSLEPIEGKGIVTWRTTFNLNSDFSPTMLSDGRVLFSSWQHYGDRHAPFGKIALLTINWSGTGLNVFYGNHEGARIQSMATEMPDRTLVFIESDGRTQDGSGNLARVSFRRPLHSRELLAEGAFRFPQPSVDGGLMVSYASDGKQYGLYHFDTEQRKVGEVIYDDPNWSDLDAQVATPRPEPMGRITIVVDSQETGDLHCLNVYDSDRPEAGMIQPGDVKWARLVEGLPPMEPPDEAGLFPSVRILGEAPVESDGSFYVRVPADIPLSIQLLDADRMALQSMRGWMWMRRGSRRGCVGCHENKELAPENRATEAIRKAAPHELLIPPEERQQVLFEKDVLPIIENRCQRCHTGSRAPRGFRLGDDVAYANLTARTKDGQSRYIVPGQARNSLVIQYLYGKKGKTMPPGRPLPEDEKQRFAAWIDLGAK